MNEAELDTNHWQRLKDVFNEAVELAPESRLSYLSALRLNDKTLYQELAELLEVNAEAEEFLEQRIVLEVDSAALTSLVGEAQVTLQKVLAVDRELISIDENNVERKISSLMLWAETLPTYMTDFSRNSSHNRTCRNSFLRCPKTTLFGHMQTVSINVDYH